MVSGPLSYGPTLWTRKHKEVWAKDITRVHRVTHFHTYLFD